MAERRAAFAERALALSGLASLAFPLFYLATTLHFVPTTATTIKNLQYVEYEAVSSAVRDAQFWPALACTLFMLLACLMGAALPRLQHRVQKILSVQILAKALPLLFYGAAGVLVLFMTYHKEFYWFCSIPGVIFCGVFGWRNAEKSCEKIFTPWVLLFSAGETVVVLLIFRIIQTKYSPTGLAWVFFVQAAICALSQNQSNLSARIKWENFEQLPAKIRWYNFFLTLGILAAILLLMLFRDTLAALGRQLLNGLKELILSLTSSAGEHTGSSITTTPNLPHQPSGWENLPQPSAVSRNPWWDRLGFLILAAVFIWYRREILEKLKELKKLAGRLSFYFPAFRSAAKKDAAYSDWTEHLSPAQLTQEETAAFRRRSWKRQVKALTQRPLDAASYREGYRLALQWLKEHGTAIEPSDTPQEILAKVPANFVSGWGTVTEQYEEIRYAESDDFEQIANITLLTILDQMVRGI